MMRAVSVLWLAFIWVVLWGQLDVRSAVGGLAIGALLVVGLPNRDLTRLDALRPIALIRYLAYYAWLVVSANAVVAWEIITPGSRVREGIVAVPIEGASDAVVSLLAHAISGTPGTLIIDIDRGETTVLYVHVLHLHDVEQVRRDVFDLERRLVEAIGSERSLAAVDRRIADLERSTRDRAGEQEGSP